MVVGLFIPVLDLEDQNPLWHFSFSGIAFFGMHTYICGGSGWLMSIHYPELKVSSFITVGPEATSMCSTGDMR